MDSQRPPTSKSRPTEREMSNLIRLPDRDQRRTARRLLDPRVRPRRGRRRRRRRTKEPINYPKGQSSRLCSGSCFCFCARAGSLVRSLARARCLPASSAQDSRAQRAAFGGRRAACSLDSTVCSLGASLCVQVQAQCNARRVEANEPAKTSCC